MARTHIKIHGKPEDVIQVGRRAAGTRVFVHDEGGDPRLRSRVHVQDENQREIAPDVFEKVEPTTKVKAGGGFSKDPTKTTIHTGGEAQKVLADVRAAAGVPETKTKLHGVLDEADIERLKSGQPVAQQPVVEEKAEGDGVLEPGDAQRTAAE